MYRSLYQLFAGKSFDFYSPYSLSEVYKRLEAMSERDHRKIVMWWRRHRLLKLSPEYINKHDIRIRGDRHVGYNNWINIEGIAREKPSGVHVSGTVRLGWFTLLFTILAYVISLVGTVGIVIMLVTNSLNFMWVSYIAFGTIVTILLSLTLKHDLDRTHAQIISGLSKTKRKEPM